MVVKESIIEEFDKLQKDLKTYIETGTVQKKMIYAACEMSKQTLDRKLQNRTFTADELMKVAKFLNNLHV